MDESLQEIKNQIQKLKKERNAVILAHYYVPGEVQDIADFVGDSFYLSKIAASAKEDVIFFCGVHFMGESAKLLSPDKTVLMPDLTADCPMAHMATAASIEKIRAEHPEFTSSRTSIWAVTWLDWCREKSSFLMKDSAPSGMQEGSPGPGRLRRQHLRHHRLRHRLRRGRADHLYRNRSIPGNLEAIRP